MRQINPLYISLLFVVLVLIVFVKLDDAKEDQNHAKSELLKTELMAKRIVALKRNWDVGKGQEQALERVFKTSVLLDAGLTMNKKGEIITVTSKKMDAKAVEFLLNKLFNGTFAIKSMELRRLNDEYASIHMEIAL
jgi:hypothetical protein